MLCDLLRDKSLNPLGFHFLNCEKMSVFPGGVVERISAGQLMRRPGNSARATGVLSEWELLL